MCGISCIISKQNKNIPHHQIKFINDLIAHRGPDAEGFFCQGNFAFGHRRLSIIDLSSDADQPLNYEERLTIIFNGEIYNYIELKEELKTYGYKFKTNSDTEVILASYDKWGKNCVNRFNGMWAFAIYDRSANIIFCSRDRFGVKPFYYLNNNDFFIFGSEIKQLLPYLRENVVNKQILLDYLIIGFEEHTNGTFFEGIFKLEQSHNLTYQLDTHEVLIERYYNLNIHPEISSLPEDDSIKYFSEKLKKSISLRLRSDVKVGTCLSGGLDSSSIAAEAAKMYDSTLNFSAITAKSIEKQTDETYFASLVAEKSCLDWHVVEPSTADFINQIDHLISIQEEPFGSPSIYMQYKVFEMAKQIGCIVMLDGQGGDETLLGYESYYPSYLKNLPVKSRLKAFNNSSNNSKLSKWELIKYYFYFTNLFTRVKKLKSKFSYVKPQYFRLINIDVLKQSCDNYRDIIKMQKYEISRIQLPHLLKYEDKNSMFHSIESRLPFLDYEMVESSISIDNDLKIKDGWTKYILRKAMENNLPQEVCWRKNKFGFNAPEGVWLKEAELFIKETIHNSNLINEICDIEKLESSFSKIDNRSKWRLFNIALWEKKFDVKWC